MRSIMKKYLIVTTLLVLGSLQMIGDVLHQPALLAIGRATNVSPAPKVFTAQNGYETFAAKFYLQYVDYQNQKQIIEITPKNYQKLRGPYNRRNMYGATISYAPVLMQNPKTRSMVEQIMKYSLRKDSPLLTDLEINADLNHPISLIIVPRNNTQHPEKFEFVLEEGNNHA